MSTSPVGNTSVVMRWLCQLGHASWAVVMATICKHLKGNPCTDLPHSIGRGLLQGVYLGFCVSKGRPFSDDTVSPLCSLLMKDTEERRSSSLASKGNHLCHHRLSNVVFFL